MFELIFNTIINFLVMLFGGSIVAIILTLIFGEGSLSNW